MELRPGYKETDLGVLPEEWEVKDLGSLRPFVTSGSRGWAAFYSQRGSPFVRITNLTRESIYLDLRDLKYVSLPPEEQEGTRTQLQEHDVLISITADIGIIGYVTSELPKPAYINQHIALVRFDPSVADGKFVSYFLASETPQKLFRASTDTGAKAGMSLITVQKLRAAFPSLSEQQAIAAALGDMDVLIASLNQLIAKKSDVKQAVVQQLITGKMRLPGFQGAWEDTTLGEIGECFIGLTYSPDDVRENGLLVLRASNVQNSRITYDDNVFVDRCVPEHLITRPGDILICVRNGSRALIGKCAKIDEASAGLTFGAFMSVYRTPHSAFLFHLFQAHSIQRQIHENIGATINQITNKDLKAFRVRLPPTDEQAAIATVLSDMDAEIAALERRRDKARDLKQGVLQELLTGRTRFV